MADGAVPEADTAYRLYCEAEARAESADPVDVARLIHAEALRDARYVLVVPRGLIGSLLERIDLLNMEGDEA